MKKIFLALAGPVMMLLLGCSISEQSSDDVAQKFQEGIRGQGQLVQPDTTDEGPAGTGRKNP